MEDFSNQQQQQQQQQQPIRVVVLEKKSMFLTVLLSFIFGPLGMLYSTILGGIVMLIVTTIVAFMTAGFGLLVTEPICIIWAIVATSQHNKKVMENIMK